MRRQTLIRAADFTQAAFEDVVKLVSEETEVLLEVVNYNIEGQQYVCAGHVS